jgi:hypothetical protein
MPVSCKRSWSAGSNKDIEMVMRYPETRDVRRSA